MRIKKPGQLEGWAVGNTVHLACLEGIHSSPPLPGYGILIAQNFIPRWKLLYLNDISSYGMQQPVNN